MVITSGIVIGLDLLNLCSPSSAAAEQRSLPFFPPLPGSESRSLPHGRSCYIYRSCNRYVLILLVVLRFLYNRTVEGWLRNILNCRVHRVRLSDHHGRPDSRRFSLAVTVSLIAAASLSIAVSLIATASLSIAVSLIAAASLAVTVSLIAAASLSVTVSLILPLLWPSRFP